MATTNVTPTPTPIEAFPAAAALPNVTAPSSLPSASWDPIPPLPLSIWELRRHSPRFAFLFDYLYTHQHDAAALNATYPLRGILKTSAMHKTTSDQKFTVDLSRKRNVLIPAPLQRSLAEHGLNEVLEFVDTVSKNYVPNVLDSLSVLAGVGLQQEHKNWTMNFRLCDYNPDTPTPRPRNQTTDAVRIRTTVPSP